MEAAILNLRKDLSGRGHDASPQTISHHLASRVDNVPSVATIWRILRRNGLVVPQPQKRPRSSFVRFEATLANEMWQTDATHWQLADGTSVEILNFLDDHSRLCVASDTYLTVKGPDVVQTFYSATQRHGFPASLLSDNAAVFSGKSRRGRVFLETELDRLGISASTRPPTTRRPAARSSASTSPRSASFPSSRRRPRWTSSSSSWMASASTTTRPVRTAPSAAAHRSAPSTSPSKRRHPGAPRPSTSASAPTALTHPALVTLRHSGQLLHLTVGRAHKGEVIRLFVADEQVRIVRDDGMLIRELILDPTRNYQGLGEAHTVHDVVRHVSNMS